MTEAEIYRDYSIRVVPWYKVGADWCWVIARGWMDEKFSFTSNPHGYPLDRDPFKGVSVYLRDIGFRSSYDGDCPRFMVPLEFTSKAEALAVVREMIALANAQINVARYSKPDIHLPTLRDDDERST